MSFNIMNEVVNESLHKICHYQQNVPQQYYVLDTDPSLSYRVACNDQIKNMFPNKQYIQFS